MQSCSEVVQYSTGTVQEESADIPTMPHNELVTAQRDDLTIARILHFLQVGG